MSEIEIIQGDCLPIMRTFDDNQFDLVLTDPPYGIKADRGVGGFGSSPETARKYKDNWDSKPPSIATLDEVLRMSKQCIVFGGNYMPLPLSGKWIVWDKIGLMKFDNPFSDCELAWTNMSGNIKKYTFIQQGFVKDTNDKRYHPTQKPTELFAEIIKDFTKEGDTVLDPFLGSGTTAVACERMGRNCVGIEISEEYCEIARKRVQEEKDKMGLFKEIE